jgi:hypothetical protein
LDKARTAFLASESAALAASAINPMLLPLALVIMAAQRLHLHRRRKEPAQALLSFAVELHRCCSMGKPISAALRRVCRMPLAPQEIVGIYREAELGSIEHADLSGIKDRSVRELAAIVAIGLERGGKVEGNLKSFISKLEADIDNRNRLMQSSLNMQGLSTIGLVFFVPMFGGIGTAIIGSSGMITGMAMHGVESSFQIVILAYITVMSYVVHALRSGNNAAECIAGAAGYAIMGAAVMRLSLSLVSYAI